MRIPNKASTIWHFTFQGIGLGTVLGFFVVYKTIDSRPIPAFLAMTLGFVIYSHGLLLHKSSRLIDVEEEVFE